MALQAAARLPQSSARVLAAVLPLTRLMARPQHIGAAEFGRELDRIFGDICTVIDSL